jgi:hypothetical protein
VTLPELVIASTVVSMMLILGWTGCRVASRMGITATELSDSVHLATIIGDRLHSDLVRHVPVWGPPRIYPGTDARIEVFLPVRGAELTWDQEVQPVAWYLKRAGKYARLIRECAGVAADLTGDTVVDFALDLISRSPLKGGGGFVDVRVVISDGASHDAVHCFLTPLTITDQAEWFPEVVK